MYKKTLNKAFTLVELMAVIAIVSIIAIWTSRVNFSSLSDRQKLDIFSNIWISNYEHVRNNALLWKGFWTPLIIPEKWKIDFSTQDYGTINTYYYNSWSWVPYQGYSSTWNYFSQLTNFTCKRPNNSIENTFTWSTNTGSIIFEGSQITLTWACDPGSKILEYNAFYRDFNNIIQINTVNGLIEIKK